MSSLSYASLDDVKYHKNVIVGGRAATMGGAYIAIADDASGAYYNPAGIGFAPSSSISGSAKVFSSSSLTYKQALVDRNKIRKSNVMYLKSLINKFIVT